MTFILEWIKREREWLVHAMWNVIWNLLKAKHYKIECHASNHTYVVLPLHSSSAGRRKWKKLSPKFEKLWWKQFVYTHSCHIGYASFHPFEYVHHISPALSLPVLAVCDGGETRRWWNCERHQLKIDVPALHLRLNIAWSQKLNGPKCVSIKLRNAVLYCAVNGKLCVPRVTQQSVRFGLVAFYFLSFIILQVFAWFCYHSLQLLPTCLCTRRLVAATAYGHTQSIAQLRHSIGYCLGVSQDRAFVPIAIQSRRSIRFAFICDNSVHFVSGGDCCTPKLHAFKNEEDWGKERESKRTIIQQIHKDYFDSAFFFLQFTENFSLAHLSGL